MSQPAALDQPAAGAGVKSSKGTMWILLCAGASLLLYSRIPYIAALLSSARPSFAFQVLPWVMKETDDSLALLHAAVPGRCGEAGFFLFCAALFAIYGVMLHLAKGCRSRASQAVLFWGAALCLLVLAVAPVMLSTDVFAYAFYGRVLSVYKSNPYAPDPAVLSDPFFALFHRQSQVSLYGPFWTLISAWIMRFTGDQAGLSMLVFRSFSALSTLAAGALIWKSLRIFAPERAGQGMVLFLWNPLVMIESGLSGHNDATMVAFAVLGVWLHLKGSKTGAVVALTLSALVKFITGMLVPLYVLMVLRGMKSWRERIFFLLRCGVCAVAVVFAVMILANVKTAPRKDKSNVPARSQATSPAFYMNNFHELIFKGLRGLLGENTEPEMMPTDGTVEIWWTQVNANTVLRSAPSKEGETVAPLEKGGKLIVITPTLILWLRVYDPASHKMGYVYKDEATHIVDPGKLAPDPVLERLELPVIQWPTVVTANRWIRIITWGLFAVFGLLAAWKTSDFDRFLTWSAAALLASYFLVMTQIWPWYILWALVFGALKPGRLPARLAILLSGFVLTYYITLDYDGSAEPWIYSWRSLPAIVLPFLLFLVTLIPWHGKSHGVPEVAVISGIHP